MKCLFLFGPYHGKFLEVPEDLPTKVTLPTSKCRTTKAYNAHMSITNPVSREAKTQLYVKQTLTIKLLGGRINETFTVYVQENFKHLDNRDEVLRFLNELLSYKQHPQLCGLNQ